MEQAWPLGTRRRKSLSHKSSLQFSAGGGGVRKFPMTIQLTFYFYFLIERGTITTILAPLILVPRAPTIPTIPAIPTGVLMFVTIQPSADTMDTYLPVPLPYPTVGANLL